MSYKPKFCCQCGEKIERVDWKLWTSRKFCELCATDFGISEKILKFVFGLSIIFGLAGFASFWRTPEKSVPLAPNQLVASAPNVNKIETNRTISPQNSSNTLVQTVQAQPNNSAKQLKNEVVPANLKTKQLESGVQEATYFCGAPTKKGTPCSRRVKGGGRCWQHAGQPAMLPQEKLIVSNN
ncbi:MAG: hypothetical protein ABWZ66_03880 [Pyrinomonadaceae bacterium]